MSCVRSELSSASECVLLISQPGNSRPGLLKCHMGPQNWDRPCIVRGGREPPCKPPMFQHSKWPFYGEDMNQRRGCSCFNKELGIGITLSMVRYGEPGDLGALVGFLTTYPYQMWFRPRNCFPLGTYGFQPTNEGVGLFPAEYISPMVIKLK